MQANHERRPIAGRRGPSAPAIDERAGARANNKQVWLASSSTGAQVSNNLPAIAVILQISRLDYNQRKAHLGRATRRQNQTRDNSFIMLKAGSPLQVWHTIGEPRGGGGGGGVRVGGGAGAAGGGVI